MNHRSTIYAGEHPAIVDPAVFEAVGERLRENGLTDGKEVRNKYGALLRGLLHCDACDMTMVQTYTVKQKQVTAEAALDRSCLHDLAAGGRLDRGAVERLLAAMQEFSAPVKPEVLGVLGEAHFREWLARGKDAGSFRYKRLTGFEEDGLPYVVECAFVITDHFWLKGTHIGINWTVPLNNPVQNTAFVKAAHETVWGLGGLLRSQRVDVADDQMCFVLHLICPKFQFLDRGKGNVYLPRAIRESVVNAVFAVTREWAKVKEKEERDQRQAERLKERMSRNTEERTSVKDAAYAVMAEAYQKASGNGRYPANARQVMYAARPAIQEATREPLKDTYFTQTLLPDYMRDHPEETAGWDGVRCAGSPLGAAYRPGNWPRNARRAGTWPRCGVPRPRALA